MKRRSSLVVPLVFLAEVALGQSPPPLPFFQDPIGPMVDVTDDWQRYQPADDFCIEPNVEDPTDEIVGLVSPIPPQGRCADGSTRVQIKTPLLCAGCRRLFFDYSKIPAENDPSRLLFYARGHVYFRISSLNPSYTVDPLAHSPNVKNFTNDKLVAPSGSLQERLAHGFDLHAMAYVGDTVNYAHTASQGPYFIGPTYLHCAKRKRKQHCAEIRGAYLDVDVVDATRLPDAALNEIHYSAGFNSGEPTCPDNLTPFADGNLFYAGCADHFGMSSRPIDPYDD